MYQQNFYDPNQIYMNQGNSGYGMYNPSQYNMNMMGKNYDMKRNPMEKEKINSFDMNFSDVNGKIIFNRRNDRKNY